MANKLPYYGNFSLRNTEDVRYYTYAGGASTFAVTYTVGYLSVYQNGRRLSASDYTATNGTSVTLTVGCTVGDEIIVIGRIAFTIPNAITQTFADLRYFSLTPTAALGNYANDTLAAAGGIPLYGIYRNGNTLQQRLV